MEHLQRPLRRLKSFEHLQDVRRYALDMMDVLDFYQLIALGDVLAVIFANVPGSQHPEGNGYRVYLIPNLSEPTYHMVNVETVKNRIEHEGFDWIEILSRTELEEKVG